MKNSVVISGGRLETEFALALIKKIKPEIIVAADKGLGFCYDYGVMPTHIVGDFDSLKGEILPYFESRKTPVRRFNPVKDATDTEIAVRLAMELGAEKITVIGAIGGNRLDHLFGNVYVLMIPAEQGISCELLDEHNRIRVLKSSITIGKSEAYGKYISLIPMTTQVEGVTLKGFKYPLTDYCLSAERSGSLGISNELVEDRGEILFQTGTLLLVESCD